MGSFSTVGLRAFIARTEAAMRDGRTERYQPHENVTHVLVANLVGHESSLVAISNFEVTATRLADVASRIPSLAGDSEDDVIRCGTRNWACRSEELWVRVRRDDGILTAAIRAAYCISARLESYAVLDEFDLSERESEALYGAVMLAVDDIEQEHENDPWLRDRLRGLTAEDESIHHSHRGNGEIAYGDVEETYLRLRDKLMNRRAGHRWAAVIAEARQQVSGQLSPPFTSPTRGM